MAPPTKKTSPAEKVKLSNLEKVFFPKAGFTKGDLVSYYAEVAPYILPHLRDRPVTLIRFPDGIDGQRFYEKNAPRFTPSWVKTAQVPRRREAGEINYIVINDADALAWCANLAAIELHPFLHRAPKLEQPTSVAFDFDPGEGANLSDCIRVAFLVKAILDELGLEAFPKVSGSKGLQLYVPLNTRVTYEATSAFAKAMAERLQTEHPDLVVSQMSKALRKGHVMIDWSQNSVSKTTVAVYSVRGKRDEPFVSMPVTWEELRRVSKTKKLEKLFFSPAAALKRLKKLGDLFAPVLTLKQTLPKEFLTLAKASSAPQATALADYSAKRDFAKTAEPRPAVPRASKKKAPGVGKKSGGLTARFVIQKHAASRLHYDFRLELEGTLKSWAVPKGVPTELGVKRSAFAVEDHPLGYIEFEGTIPKGQYGGGTVMVWDIGSYDLLGGSYESGNLKLMLHGRKLDGEWRMFKIRSDEKKPVWLIAKSGVAAKAISARQDDSSVLTRRSMAQIAAAKRAE